VQVDFSRFGTKNFGGCSMFGTKGVDNDSESLAVVRAAGPSDATANTIAALYPDIRVTGIPAVLQGLPPSNTSHG
jgi:hypothetical protein